MSLPMTGGGSGFAPMTAAGPVQYPAGYNFPIASLARWILQSIVDTFEENGTDLPARRLLTIGSVAVDTPVLAVMYGSLVVGPPGNELSSPMHVESPRSATFNIELWREEPTIGPSGMIPTEAEESAAAEAVMNDSWLLASSMERVDQLGVGVIWRVTVNPPQGGMVGISLLLDVQVP